MTKGRDQISLSDEHNSRGIELADRGWLDEAISEFKKAIELDPNSGHAHDNLATVLAEKGQLFEALVQYVEALKADPDSPTAHQYLASFLASQGHELCISAYRRAIELEYDFPEAHLNLALALAERGMLEDALAELEIAHQLAPDDDGIAHELSCCLIDLERFPEAIGHLKRIIRTSPDKIEARVDLGIAYTAQGLYTEAERVLTEALHIDQHDVAAHYHSAALYAVWGRKEDALTHLETAAAGDSDKVRMWLADDRLFETIHQEARYQRLFR